MNATPLVRRIHVPAGALLVIALLGGLAVGQTVSPSTEAKSASQVTVALYADKGAFGQGPGMLTKTFAAEADLQLVRITAADIRAGRLKEHRALIVPGGKSSIIGKTLGDAGREAIRTYVEEGGTYVGICAGCYLASREYPWSLHILPARIVDPRNSYRGRATLQLELSADGKQWLPRTAPEPKIVYHNGPVLDLQTDAGESLVPIAYYRQEITRKGAQKGLMIDTPAIVAAAHGKGWVVGISPHPEQTDGLKDVVPALIRRALTRVPKN